MLSVFSLSLSVLPMSLKCQRSVVESQRRGVDGNADAVVLVAVIVFVVVVIAAVVVLLVVGLALEGFMPSFLFLVCSSLYFYFRGNFVCLFAFDF